MNRKMFIRLGTAVATIIPFVGLAGSCKHDESKETTVNLEEELKKVTADVKDKNKHASEVKDTDITIDSSKITNKDIKVTAKVIKVEGTAVEVELTATYKNETKTRTIKIDGFKANTINFKAELDKITGADVVGKENKFAKDVQEGEVNLTINPALSAGFEKSIALHPNDTKLEVTVTLTKDGEHESKTLTIEGFKKPDYTKEELAAKAKEIGAIFEAYDKSNVDTFGKDDTKLVLFSPTKDEAAKIVKNIDATIAKLQAFVKDIEGRSNTKDLMVWADAAIYDYNIAKDNYSSDLRLLFPAFNWGASSSFILDGFVAAYMGISNKEQAQRWLNTLKEAIAEKVVPSKVFIKDTVKSILLGFYKDKLDAFAEDANKTEITVKDLIGLDPMKQESEYKVQDWIDKFYTEYATTYYKASAFGVGENLPELKLTKTQTIKEEKSIVATKKDNSIVTLYGLGKTDKDLNQENAGLGFIPDKGQAIYKVLLKMQTTSDYTPQQIYDEGYSTTVSSAKNTEAVAKKIADLITGTPNGEWKETFKYDEDGLEEKEAADVTLVIRDASGNVNLENFYKWLNQEAFFFGREDSSYYTDTIKNALKATILKGNDGVNPDPNFVKKDEKAVDDLTKKGYDVLIDPANKDKKYGSITNEQFYYGALTSYVAYDQFKRRTFEYGREFFKTKVPSYGVQTYGYSVREQEGVGSENPNEMKFTFNADPYYSLQKWSVTSFANHESMMGHHNQLCVNNWYKTEIEGVKSPLNLDYNSYIEGWALFMEWFGIEAGFYGTTNYASNNLYDMPIDFSKAKGITSFYKGEATLTKEMIDEIKGLHNGVYWANVDSKGKYTSDEQLHAKKAIELCNMLQYIGALNEAQLRNMRLAIDTAYHGGNLSGKADLKNGASINQARAFMKKYSALGAGDISSESVRYHNYVGQATSYNSGKKVFMELYTKVREKLGKSREQFVNEKTDIQTMFDVFLRYGTLPMETVVKATSTQFGLK